MGAVRAEFLKLKRSLSWAVVVLLPVTMVLAGAVNTVIPGGQIAEGWHTVWMRSVVFQGLFPLAIGIAILASLVWRVEHRGGNWNALMSGPTPSVRIVIAKTTVVAVLALVMQAVLAVTVVVVGKLVFGLPGMLPGTYVAISVLIVVACLPVAALQSGLSMLTRSFATPIAVAFLGACASIVLLLGEFEAALFVVPYALLGPATQLGTGLFTSTGVGTITSGDAVPLVIASALLTAALLAGTALLLDRRDTHA